MGPARTRSRSRRAFLADFEQRHCYDRYWDGDNPASGMNTRFVFCGVAFAMVTRHEDERTDLVHTFRRQFFQIGLIANFHKAALLNLSNRFSIAVERLRVGDYASVRSFKDSVREALELFLRFNHRYWVHEISNQVLAADIFSRWAHQLGSDSLFREVREEAQDINQYLDADRTRRAGDNAMRLTVVMACSAVGTVATGFLGMNLFNHAGLDTADKVWIFLAVFVPTTLLGLYTVMHLQAPGGVHGGAVVRAPHAGAGRWSPSGRSGARRPGARRRRGAWPAATSPRGATRGSRRGAPAGRRAGDGGRLDRRARPARSSRSGSASRVRPRTGSRARRGSARMPRSTRRSGAVSSRCTRARRSASATAGARIPTGSSR